MKENYTIGHNAWTSVFYLTTGFHALHVTGGLLALFLLVLGRTYLCTPSGSPTIRPPGRDRRVVLLALRRRGVDRPVLRYLRIMASSPDAVESVKGHSSVVNTSAFPHDGAIRRWRAFVVLFFCAGHDRRGIRHPGLIHGVDGWFGQLANTPDQVLARARSSSSQLVLVLPQHERPGCTGLGPVADRGRRRRTAVDFQVGTGRMPAQQPGPQIQAKPGNAYDRSSRRTRSTTWPAVRIQLARRRPCRSPTRRSQYAADLRTTPRASPTAVCCSAPTARCATTWPAPAAR